MTAETAAVDPWGTDGVAVDDAPDPMLEPIEIDTHWQSQEPLSIGVHQVVCTVEDIPQGPKGRYLKMRFEGAEEEGDEAGLVARDNVSTSKAAKFKMDAFLAALDWPRGKSPGDTVGAVIKSFSGQKLTVVVDHEEYQDVVRAKVVAYLPKGAEEGITAKVGAGEFA